MSGEINLTKLLQNMKPELNAGEYVYCLADSKEQVVALDPLCYFLEEEGVTMILPKEKSGRDEHSLRNDLCMDHAHGPFFTRSSWPDRGSLQSPDRSEY
ncbi:ACT domain-containing protein [Candidatus Villigracilis affinis]|uniref:ACT domain-containing protein n=1 Tax=Candidatus Villigracilis affinis TaxID=3140682 RepID=UPI0031EBB607